MSGSKTLSNLDEFLFQAPLYDQYVAKRGSPELGALYNRNESKLVPEGHCPFCGRLSNFHVRGQSIPSGDPWNGIGERFSYADQVDLICTRNSIHVINFIFRINKLSISKIGQYPSLADIALDESKIYRSVLSKEDSAELHKAIGLASHGIGVGSFVYLRRIFERLIYNRFLEAKNAQGWIEEDFRRLRMNEKISFLRGHLPSFLVDNSKIYSILSAGIHELKEAQCLSYFEIMKQSIVIILDEDKRNKEESDRKEQFSKAIAQFDAS